MSGQKHPSLRLVRGGKGDGRPCPVRIRVTPPDEGPAVDAVVLEEDTWLILSTGPEVTAPADHAVRLLTELHEAEPLAPGTVLVREEHPLKLLAVVHDFGADPCCRPEWIEAALAGILRICRERQLRSLLLPLLGVRHGRVRPEDVVPLIARTIRSDGAAQLATVHLQVPAGNRATVEQLLSALPEEAGDEG
ncbi:MAG TPA: hypothetical protein VK187_03110 [Geobacteraceae bacterium]|nr:hypothetical protein [Geobacteraceae bacterium]